MNSVFFSVLFYSVVAGAATLAAALAVLRNKEISDRSMIYLVSFSAGVLLALVFFHLLPEALSLNPNQALYAAVAAFVSFYLLEQQIIMHSCSEGKCDHHHIERSKGLVGLWGIMLHSLIDGALLGVGFEVHPALGLLMTFAVLIHKVPDGLSVSTIMLHSGFSIKDTLKGSILVSCATPLGAVLSYLLLRAVSQGIIGIALGLSAGTFLYISASDLIPETHKNFNFLNGMFVILGIGLIAFARYII